MLCARAAYHAPSSGLRNGFNTQWRRSKFISSTKRSAQESMNKTTEEELITRTLLQTSDSAFIRTWTFPESMRDAFSIIRAVERKYGLIREFKYDRDFEVPSNYQLLIRVAFRDPESQKRIPEEAEELEVVLPPALPDHQSGGIGLADLEEHLSSTESPLNSPSRPDTMSIPNLSNVMASVMEETQAKAESENATRVITCRIQRARVPFYTPSHITHYWMPRQERDAIGRQFLNWGGFHDFPPIEKDTSLPDKDFFGSPKLEHFRMRRCLRRASKYLEVPNPYEYSPEHLPASMAHTEESSELEWEPLSDPTPDRQEHDVFSATLEETQDTDIFYNDATLPRTLTSQASDDSTTHDRSSSTAEGPSQYPTISLHPETADPQPQPSTNTTIAQGSALLDSAPFSDKISHSKELAAQLRAARSLARQVTEEQRKQAKPKLPEESLKGDSNVQVKGPLLEEDVSAGTSAVDPKLPRPKMSGKTDDPPPGDSKGVMGKLKNAWGELF